MKTYLEFFAGVGLVREGLSFDEWECLWANDFAQDKKDTYIENYGDEHFVLADIWDVVKDSDNLPEAFMYTVLICQSQGIEQAWLVLSQEQLMPFLKFLIKKKRQVTNQRL
jgi:hypothetical protein